MSGDAAGNNLTQQQEAFALAYVETGNASEAYRRAYNVKPTTKPESIWNCASRILRNVEVQARVAELREHGAEMALFSREQALAEFEEARVLAREGGQPAAMVSATTGKAKLLGLMSERVKSELTGPNGRPIQTEDVSDPTDLARRVAFLLAQGSRG